MTLLAYGLTISVVRTNAIVARRLAVTPPLGVPELESAARRGEVGGELVLERGDLVAELEELVREPALVVAQVLVAHVGGDGFAAVWARHVPGLGERGKHRRRERAHLIGRFGRGREGSRVAAAPSALPQAVARAGITPSCCISPSVSQLVQLSTNLPATIRSIVIPVTVACLPVGAIPIRSP